MALYVSEFARFMQAKMKENADWGALQKEGRSLLWERKKDWAEEATFAKAKVPQKAYPYDILFDGES